MNKHCIDRLIRMCSVSKPDLVEIERYIVEKKLTAEEVTYTAIKVCEKGAFEQTELAWMHGRPAGQDELLTNDWVALFDVFIRNGMDADLVFSDGSEYDNIMYELKNLENGDMGPTILRNILRKGGNPNTKIGGWPLFWHVDHDVLFDVVELEDKKLFDTVFHFWLVLMGFGGYINDHECPVKMAVGYTQSIFKDFEKFDYRIEYGNKDWTMHIFYKENGEEVAIL